MRKQNGLNNDWIKKMCEAGPMRDEEGMKCKLCDHIEFCSDYVKDYYEKLF